MTKGLKEGEPNGRDVYPDIIDHPHWQSPTRPHMSLYDRAAQFSSFDALAGYSDMVKVGRCIKHYRSEKKLSQEELANSVIASSNHISYIETDVKTPSLEMLILIGNTLDVSADDLLTDNLKHSSSPVDTEIHDLLLDCNHDEKAILTRTLTFLKALLSEFGV